MQFIKLTVLTVLATAAMFGQTSAINGEIQGTITDPTGAVVPKVTVEILNDGTGFKRTMETSESGCRSFSEEKGAAAGPISWPTSSSVPMGSSGTTGRLGYWRRTPSRRGTRGRWDWSN